MEKDLTEPLLAESDGLESDACECGPAATGAVASARALDAKLAQLWGGACRAPTSSVAAGHEMLSARARLDDLLSSNSDCTTIPGSLQQAVARFPKLTNVPTATGCVGLESIADLERALTHVVFAAPTAGHAGIAPAAFDNTEGAVREEDLVPLVTASAVPLPPLPSLREVGYRLLAAKEPRPTAAAGDINSGTQPPQHRFWYRVASADGSTRFGTASDDESDSDSDAQPGAGADAADTFADAHSGVVDDDDDDRSSGDAAAAAAHRRALLLALRRAISRADCALAAPAARTLAERAARAAAAAAEAAPSAALDAARAALAELGGDVVLESAASKFALVVDVSVGVGAWGRGHYGLGFSVSAQHRVRVGLRAAASGGGGGGNSGSGADDFSWGGSVVCDVCRSFPLLPPGRDGSDVGGAAGADADAFRDAVEVARSDSVPLPRAMPSCHVVLRVKPPGLVMSSEAVAATAAAAPTAAAAAAGAGPAGADNVAAEDEETASNPDAGDDGAAAAADAAAAAVRAACCAIDAGHAYAPHVAAGGGGVTELLCWGRNDGGCLGAPGGVAAVAVPSPPPLRGLAPGERVAHVACSARHAVLVTSLGGVYTAGEGRGGALGHGAPAADADAFRRVDWFDDGGGGGAGAVAVAAAAGCDPATGCHTVVLCADGRAFAFGAGHATGTGCAQPVLLPAPVALSAAAGAVAAVAAGGGFALALTARGAVYGGGLWGGGRLGLGSAPAVRGSAQRRRVARFRLRPTRVEGLPDGGVVGVAAGARHALALCRDGSVYAWGDNTAGQLGAPHLAADASWIPVKLEAFGPPHGGAAAAAAAAIACGRAHSVVIDADGAAWTWGTGGGSGGGSGAHACLGHGDAITDEGGATGSVARREQEWQRGSGGGGAHKDVQGWSTPRKVAALDGVALRAAACGDAHTLLLARDGGAYLCGAGAAVQDGITADDPGLPALTVTVPRAACADWLPELEGCCIAAAACGGEHAFAIAAGDLLGHTLGRALLARAAEADFNFNSSGGGGGAAAGEEDGGGDARAPDVLLLAAGTALHAHRCVVAQRSPRLRDMLAAEFGGGGGSGAQLPRLLLPDVRAEVARALREFLYTDALVAPLDAAAPLVHDLLAAARAYGAPRLAAICAAALPAAAAAAARGDDDDDDDAPLLPLSTLAADLGGALGDPAHADVRFVAVGGAAIYAHRAVLAARCEYFAAMFGSAGMAESRRPRAGSSGSGTTSSASSTSGDPHADANGGGGAAQQRRKRRRPRRARYTDVVVPDSHVAMLRLLLYAYTGRLAPAAPDALLEDLAAADRYRLLGMRRACESLLGGVGAACALPALQAAYTVRAPRLRAAALACAAGDLARVATQPGFGALLAAHPRLAEDLLAALARRAARGGGAAAAAEAARRARRRQRAARVDHSFASGEPFPWAALATAFAAAALYSQMGKVVAIGVVVPVLNVLFLGGTLWYGYVRMARATRGGATSKSVARDARGR